MTDVTQASTEPASPPSPKPEHPHDVLHRIDAGLRGTHTDVREHLGKLTKAVTSLTALLRSMIPPPEPEKDDGKAQ